MKQLYKLQQVKWYLIAVVITAIIGCTDDFAEKNSNPGGYNEATPSQLFVNLLQDSYFSNGYFYYTSSTVRNGLQYTVSENGALRSGSISAGIIHYNELYNTYSYAENIRSLLNEEEKVRRAITYIPQAICALRAVKEYGDIPYVEAGKARVGGSLFPKYDHTEEIFATLNEELKSAVATIEAEADLAGKAFDADYDFMYGGDAVKWAKLANVLRLDIAITLAQQNETLAKQICAEVAASSSGVFSGTADEYRLDPGKPMPNTANSLPYSGGGDNISGRANLEMVNMMKRTGDPRLGIFVLPSSLSVKGVRYLNNIADTTSNATIKANIKDLFTVLDTTETELHVLTKGEVPAWRFIGGSPFVGGDQGELKPLYRTYTYCDWDGDLQSGGSGRFVLSAMNRKIQNPDYNGTTSLNPYFEEQNRDEVAGQYVLPIMPYSYMCLLMAQLDYLNLWDNPQGKSYQEWYEAGVEASIRMYDYIAVNHKTNPYNWKRSDAELNDAIANYLSAADVALTGAGDWEKICLQQYLNCYHLEELAADHVLRTGFPSENSTILKWGERSDYVTRRSAISRPSAEEDEANWLEAVSRQGFTPGVTSTIVLHSQRIWYDQKAPDFGKGNINK